MQLKKLALIICIPATLMLSGCVISVGDDDHGYSSHSWEDKEVENRSIISSLNLKVSENEVTSRLGVPDFTELHQSDAGNVKVLFYRTHRNKGDGVTTKDECTPLVFVNSQLVGWGDSAYRKI